MIKKEKYLLVQSPAGSGKTRMLVDRYMYLLESSTPEEILAITFTRKAANEMKQRISKQIEDKKMNIDMKYSRIQTIDSFLNSVLTRYDNQYKDKKPRILNESEATNIYEQAIQNLIKEFLPECGYYEEMQTVIDILDYDYQKLKDTLVDILSNRSKYMYSIMDAYRNGSNISDTQKLLYINKEYLSEYTKRHDIDANKWKELCDSILTKELEIRKRITKKDSSEFEYDINDRILEFYLQNIYLTPKDPCISDIDNKNLLAISKVTIYALAYLMSIFEKTNTIDYQEIMIRSCQLICDMNLDMNIRHILIDEFQDTSILQYKLFNHIASEIMCNEDSTVFLVGDPMQSIYGFRDADVGSFIDIKRNGFGNQKFVVHNTTKNYRSDKSIIEHVNKYFNEDIFCKTENSNFGIVQYTESVSHRVSNDAVVQILNAHSDDQEAEMIFNIIQSIDPNESIAVLIRSRSYARKIIEILEGHKYPFHESEVRCISDNTIVNDLHMVTRILINIEDRYAWMCLFRSEFFRFDIQFIHSISVQLEHGIRTVSDSSSKIKEFLSFIDSISGIELISNKIGETWNRFSSIFTYTEKDSDSIVSYIDSIKQLEQMSGSITNHNEILKIVDGEYLDFEKDKSNVYLMTIHKSKGLEFDNVIIPGIGKRNRSGNKPLLYNSYFRNKDGSLFYMMAHSDSELGGYLEFVSRKREQMEEKRLMYVAMTRAKKGLYMIYRSHNCN